MTLSLTAVGLLASSCSGLSKEAKEIVGTYYNTEISQTEPVMVLRKMQGVSSPPSNPEFSPTVSKGNGMSKMTRSSFVSTRNP